MKHLEEFTAACFECAYWADIHHPDAETNGADLHPDTEARLEADCHSFWARCWFYVDATDMTPAQAGHDFWLSRNGHGAGFWDGDWDHTPYADTLDKLAKCYGEIELYLGDDGMVHA